MLRKFSTSLFRLAKGDNAAVLDGGVVNIPLGGKSSGNEHIDQAVQQWKRTNTEEDARLQKLFAKQKTSSLPPSMRQTNIEDIDEAELQFSVGLGDQPSKEKIQQYGINAGKNEKTGEVNGPTGPEPTRYGDWERSGRVSDF